MGIEGANLKNESLFQTFVALRNERLQMVMYDASSETQGQLVGAGKSLNGRGKKSGEEKSRTKIGYFVLDFSSPDFFPRPLRLFPAPTNCPWVSEDVCDVECYGMLKFCATGLEALLILV